MIPNNNLSILPFYDSLDKQIHNKSYAYGKIWPLITEVNSIPTFQIIRPDNVTALVSVTLKGVNSSVDDDITLDMNAAGLELKDYSSDGYMIFKFPSTAPMTGPYAEGQYYLEFEDDQGITYSEIFTMVEDISKYIKLEYGNSESIVFNSGLIDFEDSFKFKMYIPSEIGKPEYEFEEETTDLDGYKFTEKQVSEKRYVFNFLAPEYVCDALRIVRMSDFITITDLDGSYDVETFLMTPAWEDDGYLASVEVEFECDTVVKKINARHPDITEDALPTGTKMYIGLIDTAVPTEAQIKAQLEERTAVKEDQSRPYFPTLGKRTCFAYPAEYGLLGNVYVFSGWSLLTGYNLTQETFTFGSEQVLMNIYTYKYEITYAIAIQFTRFYEFIY